VLLQMFSAERYQRSHRLTIDGFAFDVELFYLARLAGSDP